jgi:hypothetical protein
MSLKPSTPDHERKIGRQMGRERARLDRVQGVRQQPDRLWRPATASDAYVEGLCEGYREEFEDKPRSLEDLA